MRDITGEDEKFDSNCASLSCCATKGGFYANVYICTKTDTYILPKRNSGIYNTLTKTPYKNSKEVANAGIATRQHVKDCCKDPNNTE